MVRLKINMDWSGSAYMQVVSLANKGLTTDEISRELKLPAIRIRSLASYARSKGYPVLLHKQSDEAFIKNAMRGASTGGAGKVLQGLPREVITWLCDQVPKGGTLADIVRAIICDAHDEEVTSSAKPD